MTTQPPLNIMHIASGDLWAGAEVQLYTLASQQQRSEDTTVTVVLMNPGRLQQELQQRGIDVIVVDENRHHSGSIFLQLLRILNKHRPDIVHTHRVKENILGGIAAWLKGIPSVRTTHGASEHRPHWYQLHKHVQSWLDGFSGRYLQKAVIAVSDELAGKLSKRFPRKHIHVIENGIDIEETIQASLPETNSDEPAPNSSFTVGLIGRIVAVKRVDLFIDTARFIAEHHPDKNITFKVYGDGPLLEEMKQYGQPLVDSGKLSFMGHCDAIQKELRKLDALLITSDHEGLPMVLLEAMCLDTVVISHHIGAIPQVLDNGACGILVPEQNINQFAVAITELYTDNKLRTLLAENALARVHSRYSATHNASSTRQLYNTICKQAD